MGQIGVEGDAVAGGERVFGAVDVQDERALLQKSGLARSGLVARRVALSPGDGAGGERVARDLCAEDGQPQREHLVGVTARAAAPAVTGADDADRALLVEAQELR